MKSFILASLLLTLSQSGWASSSNAYKLSAATEQSGRGQVLLRLNVQDAQPKTGVCPYYVKSQQYLEAVKILNLEIYQENCNNDAYGVSKGEAHWFVPASLLNNGSEIRVLVNQNAAAILTYDEAAKTFRVKN